MIDRKAMVQAEGSHLWRPLREVLVEEHLADREAERRRAQAPKAPPSPPDDLLDGPPIGIGEPAGIQTLADDPGEPGTDAAGGAPSLEDDVPAVPLKPLEGPAELPFPAESPPASPAEASPVDDHPILEVLGDEPEAARPDPVALEAETPLDSSAVDENPILELLGDEPGAPGPEPVGPDQAALDEMPVIPFKPLEDESPRPADRTPGDLLAEPPGAPAPSDDGPLPAPWQQEDLPPAPPPPPPEVEEGPHVQADDAIAPPPIPPSSTSELDDGPLAIALKSLDDDEAETLPPAPFPDDGPPSGGLGATLLGAAGALGAFFSRFLEPINRLERGQPPREPGPSPQTPTTSTFQKLRGTVSAWTDALGERVARLTRREEPVAPVPPTEPAPLPMEPDASPFELEVPPVEPLATPVEPSITPPEPALAEPEPTDAEPEPTDAEPEPAYPEPEPAYPEPEPAYPEPEPAYPEPEPEAPPTTPLAPSPPRPAVREVSKPPPSMSELPSVPLAERHEPREVGDMYEGDDGESVLPVLWHWTKRLVLLATLVGGGAFLALNWDAWIPTAAELGNKTFTEIDKLARSGERKKQQDQLLQEIGPQLTQLAPETIRLVLSRSPTGILDAPEVFWTATAAVDRGLETLTPEEAQELEALRLDLIGGLTPSERERVREYEETRARREPFPVENSHALALYARGARALPPEKRERFQALLGQAIAAGLEPPPGDEPR